MVRQAFRRIIPGAGAPLVWHPFWLPAGIDDTSMAIHKTASGSREAARGGGGRRGPVKLKRITLQKTTTQEKKCIRERTYLLKSTAAKPDSKTQPKTHTPKVPTGGAVCIQANERNSGGKKDWVRGTPYIVQPPDQNGFRATVSATEGRVSKRARSRCRRRNRPRSLRRNRRRSRP